MKISKWSWLIYLVPVLLPPLSCLRVFLLPFNAYEGDDITWFIVIWCVSWILGMVLILWLASRLFPEGRIRKSLSALIALAIAFGPPLRFLFLVYQGVHSENYRNMVEEILAIYVVAFAVFLLGWAIATVMSVWQIIQLNHKHIEVSQTIGSRSADSTQLATFKSHFVITAVGAALLLASGLLLVVWLSFDRWAIDQGFLVWPILFAGAGLGLVIYGIGASKKA